MSMAVRSRRQHSKSSSGFTDDFARPDGAVKNGWWTGNNWEMLLSSGRLQPQGTGSSRYDSGAVHSLLTAPTFVEVDIVGTAGSAGRSPYIYLGSVVTSGVFLTIEATGSWKLWTTPGTVRASGTGPIGNCTVRLQKAGNVFTAYSNGSPIVSWTDSTNIAIIDNAITLYSESDIGQFPTFSFDNLKTDAPSAATNTFTDSFNRANSALAIPPYGAATTAHIIANNLTSSSGSQIAYLPYDGGDFELTLDATSGGSGLYCDPGVGAAAKFVWDPSGRVQLRSPSDNSILYETTGVTTTHAVVKYAIVADVYSIYVGGVLKLAHDFGVHTRRRNLDISLLADINIDSLIYTNGAAPALTL